MLVYEGFVNIFVRSEALVLNNKLLGILLILSTNNLIVT